MKPAFVAALAVAASATFPHVAASSEGAPFCAPLPAELVAWGLPAGEATRTIVMNTSRQRTVHAPDNASRTILTVVSAKPTGEKDTREAFNYDETIEQTCLVKRDVEGDFRSILLALSLGAKTPRSLIALTQETTVLIATSTERTHRVSLDEHMALSFLLLAGPDATWKDVVNVTDTYRTFRTTMSTTNLSTSELLDKARAALDREIPGSAPGNVRQRIQTLGRRWRRMASLEREQTRASAFGHAASMLAREAAHLSVRVQNERGAALTPATRRAMAHAEEAACELDRLAATHGGLDDMFRAAVWAMTSAAVALQLARESMEPESDSHAR